ncbi:DUF4245 domain-containing protein [Arthrobacter sp. AL12]|uniref:DUF4245 domain-containing protein n=1 Tax=Arthrobacter sp. AL12 TaxID=3042241 RepID=UPI00249C63E8|nr:DUF4245 domain-containing protein [Arthrobacter sp. AL12]MDI3212414.1 DUF4245 domain-containing protein [Arthrobacter sp. AL12]
MGDYRGVSELQETPPAAPASPAGTPGREVPGAAGQPPVKPVLSAGAAKRANASVMGMIIALVLSIAAFLPIVLMNPSPKTDGYRPNVNVSAVAQNAADVAGFTPVAPDAGDTFRANYARWQSGTGSGVPTWEVGYLTPKESFIGLVQTRQSNPTWLLQQVKSAPVTGTRNAGGRDWELRDTGKDEKSMVLADAGGTTVILTGSAQLDEFTALAAAVVKDLEGKSGTAGPASPGSTTDATVSPSAVPSP